MSYFEIENYLNRFCFMAIFYAGLIIVSLSILPNSIIPIQLPSIVYLFTGDRLSHEASLSVFYFLIILTALIVTLIITFLPKKIIPEINFWLLILVCMILPFAYSRDTKENFLLVKETILRLFLISMLAIFLFRKLATGNLNTALSKVPWHLYAFVFFGIISYLWSKSPYMTIHYSLILISYLVFYTLTTDTLKKPWQFYSLSDILITAAAIASMYGILQYYRVAGTNHNYDPLFGIGEVVGNTDRKRVFSFFGNPVFLGVYLDAALPIAFALFFSSFAAGAKWAHKYEKWILRSQIILLFFAITYCFVFMGLANSSVNALIEASKLPNGPQITDSKVSDLITQAGSTSFVITPIIFTFLFLGAYFLYQITPYWQIHEKQIYRLVNSLISFLAIFMCIFITFTRTAWIATFVSLCCFVLYLLFYAHDLIYKYRKWILSFTVVVIISTIILTIIYFKPNPLNTGTESIAARFTSAFTVLQRIMLYDITLDIIKLSPWLGHGLGTFGKFYPEHQAKFYKGEIHMLIDWINSFCKNIIPNKIINFSAWSFEKVSTSRFFQTLMIIYFIIFTLGGVLLIIYWKDLINQSKAKFKVSLLIYVLLITIPVILVYFKFLASNKVYLGINENLLSTNPKDYHWLSAGFAHVHNEYLQVWSDLGIFALILFLYVFLDYFIKGHFLLKDLKTSPDRVIIIGYLCAVVAMLVESIANFPFQRIMPIVIATLGFSLIFNGKEVFKDVIESFNTNENLENNAISYNKNVQNQNLNNEELFDDYQKYTLKPKEEREYLKQNWLFYAFVSLSVLLLNYFPIRYVLANIDLKSGHTFISQAQLVRHDENKFRIILMEGLRYLERSVQRIPYNAEAIFWLGDTLKLLGRYDEAIERFNQSISLVSTKHVFYSRGTAYFEKYKQEGKKEFLEQAKKDWKRSIEINPNFPQPLFQLGYQEFYAGNFKLAYEYFMDAIKWDNNEGLTAEAYKFAGLAAYYLKDDTNAINCLSNAYKRGIKSIAKYLGNILTIKKQYEEAIACLEDALDDNPSDKDVYSNLVLAYTKLNKFSEALKVVEKYYHSNKNSAEYFYDLGRIYTLQKNFDKALIELGRGLEKYPNDIKINEEIGRIYFEEKKNYQTATQFFEKLYNLQPENLRIYYNLGACYYKMGNYQKAYEVWVNIKQKEKDFPEIEHYIQNAKMKLSESKDITTSVEVMPKNYEIQIKSSTSNETLNENSESTQNVKIN